MAKNTKVTEPETPPEKPRIYFGLNKIKGGWQVEKLTIQSNGSVKRHKWEPDMRAISEEKFNREFNQWLYLL